MGMQTYEILRRLAIVLRDAEMMCANVPGSRHTLPSPRAGKSVVLGLSVALMTSTRSTWLLPVLLQLKDVLVWSQTLCDALHRMVLPSLTAGHNALLQHAANDLHGTLIGIHHIL